MKYEHAKAEFQRGQDKYDAWMLHPATRLHEGLKQILLRAGENLSLVNQSMDGHEPGQDVKDITVHLLGKIEGEFEEYEKACELKI